MLYDTKKHISEKRTLPILTKKDVLLNTSEHAVFRKYIGDFRVGSIIKSPLRKDENPSFGIFYSKKDNTLLYKDLANGDCGDCFKFVKTLFGFKDNRDVYREILGPNYIKANNYDDIIDKGRALQKKTISVKRRQMDSFDIEYWNSFQISRKTLSFFKVNAISLYLVNNEVKATYTRDNPMYCYKVFDKFKIYRPFARKQDKWRGNLSSLDIMGYEQLPEEGELLIITKSLKDVMVLNELGYAAIAPPSESTIIPKVVIDRLKSRFKDIFIFYDRDRTGVLFTRKLSVMFGLDFMFIDKKYEKKDISDYIKMFGRENTAKFICNKIEKLRARRRS